MSNSIADHDLRYLASPRSDSVRNLPLSKKYRSCFEIIALILEAARSEGKDRYSLMRNTSVNYAQLKQYLGSLLRIGFIENTREGKKGSYKATEKGLDFLGQYYVLLGMLLSANSTNLGSHSHRINRPLLVANIARSPRPEPQFNNALLGGG